MAGRTAGTLTTFVAGALVALALPLISSASPTAAHWEGEGAGTGAATTGVLTPPSAVTVPPTSAGDVHIQWTASPGPLSPAGYYVTRDSMGGPIAACGTAANSLTLATACTDTAVPNGTFTYSVTAVYLTWTAVSLASSATDVATAASYAHYSVLGSTIVNTLESSVSGDIGVTPAGAVSGFPPGTVGGSIHLNDPDAASADAAFATAYEDAADLLPTNTFSGDLNGRTFTEGVHRTASALILTGTLTLSGDADSVFVFQVDAALDTAAASHVVLAGGLLASNVYWQVGGAATLGANSTFAGTVLAFGAITLGNGAVLIGRALSNETITLANNTIRFTENLPPTIAIAGGAAAVTKDTTPTLTGTTDAGAGSTVTVTVADQTLIAAVGTDGSWATTAVEMPAATYTVVAKVKDLSGNGATTTQDLLVEVNPPTIDLGAASSFAILADSSVVSPGVSHLWGDLGVGVGGTTTGFPPGTVGGVIHAGDQAAADAATAMTLAYADGTARIPHTEFAGDQIGNTFHAGVHHTSTAFSLTGTMILDGETNPDAVFIFQIGAAMSPAASTFVQLINGATAENVFWIVNGAVTTGANSSLVGTIMADGPITLGGSMQLVGRALSTGTVTLADNTVVAP